MEKTNPVFKIIFYLTPLLLPALICVNFLYAQADTSRTPARDTTVSRNERSGRKDTIRAADTSDIKRGTTTGNDSMSISPGSATQPGTTLVEKVFSQLSNNDTAGIGDAVIVQINNFDAFWNESLSRKKKILLYLNGHALTGIEPQQNAANQLRFELQINEKNKDNWEKILNWNFENVKKVAITVGLEESAPLPTNVKEDKAFSLLVVPRWTWLLFLSIMLGVLALLIWAASKKGMLREKGYPVPAGESRVFSLGLTQMAFWIYIVFGSFVLLFIIMKQVPSFNASVLVLIGISTLTALGSSLINTNKFEKERESRVSARAEFDMLAARVAEIDTKLEKKNIAESERVLLQGEKDTKSKKLLEVQDALLLKKEEAIYPKSRGFIMDILADGGEVNLYRVQILLWTLVLGGIFLYKVIKELAMPEYDATLLSLMGISSGTYIGFKLPEKGNAG